MILVPFSLGLSEEFILPLASWLLLLLFFSFNTEGWVTLEFGDVFFCVCVQPDTIHCDSEPKDSGSNPSEDGDLNCT